MRPDNDQTFRTNDARDGRSASCRFTYRPDWSPSKPWCCVWRGTATNCFATLREALKHEGLHVSDFSAEDHARILACMDYRTPTKQVLEGGEYVTVLDSEVERA